MKVYIAGKITGDDNYYYKFARAEKYLQDEGHITMNPAVLNLGFTWHEYIKVTLAMLEVCDAIYLLSNYVDSEGAMLEYEWAQAKGKKILFENEEEIDDDQD